MINEQNSNRWSENITTMSVVCACLIIFIHSYNLEYFGISQGYIFWIEEVLAQGIARIAVPFFFVNSAFLLYRKNRCFDEVLLSKTKSILVPYLLWNTFYALAFYVLGELGIVHNYTSEFSVRRIIQEVFFYKSNYSFWFVYQLLLFVLLNPVIELVLRKGKVLSWSVLGVIWLVYLCYGEVLSGYGLYLIQISSLGYYLLGAILGRYYDEYKNIRLERKYAIGVCTVSGILFCFIFGIVNVLRIEQLQHLECVRNISLLAFIWTIINQCNIRISGWLSKITFAIYALHPLILEGIEKVIIYLCPYSEVGALIDFIVAPCITIIAIWFVTKVWAKLSPKSYRLFTGGR